MKLCSRLLMIFAQNLCENNKFGYLNPILRKLGVTHDIGWWLVGKPMLDFLSALIELFSVSITVRFRSYEAKCIHLGCFRRGSLCTRILPRHGRPPATTLGVRKLEILGCPMWRPHPSAFPRFDATPECDGQTDGQTDGWRDGFAVAYTALLCCAL